MHPSLGIEPRSLGTIRHFCYIWWNRVRSQLFLEAAQNKFEAHRFGTSRRNY